MTDAEKQALIGQAIAATQNAYIPYSGYAVGAALRTVAGDVYTGCNIENASYPATICAERTALVKAVSEGAREFDVIVVATRNGGSPCGICRQMLFEFAPELQVIMVDFDGNIHAQARLNDLLLHGFSGSKLDVK